MEIKTAKAGLGQAGLAQAGSDQNEAPGAPPVQSIGLTGIPTNTAVGALVLIRGQIIALPGIASNAAVGSITLATSQGVILPGIPSNAKVGVPTITGGLMKTSIFIGGIDRSSYLKPFTAAFASQTMGRWNANFDLQVNDGVWAPSLGQTVLIQDFGRTMFAGCISEIIVDRAMSTVSVITFRVQALDKASICDHRQVTAELFVAGTDAADIFRAIATRYLNGEGLTTGLLPSSFDTIDSDLPLNFCTVTSAFDQVATLVGASWGVDITGQLYLRRIASADVCPFSFTETSKNFRNLTVRYTLAGLKTAVYVRSNLSTLPGSPANAGITFQYTVQQAEAAAAGLAQGAGVLPVPAASILLLKVNGVAKTVYYAGDVVTYDITNPLYGRVWWMFPDTNIVIPPGSATAVPSPPEKPSLGDVISVQFIPAVAQSTQVVKSTVPFVPTAMPGITPAAGESYATCGSGIYEWTEQVNDIVLIADLEAIGQAILARDGTPTIILRAETDVPGAYVGQKIRVILPAVYVPDQYLFITSVQAHSEAVDLLQNRPDLKWDGRGSSFRYTIEATNIQDDPNWRKFWERLIRRTEHPNPVIRQELITFIIAPGGSVVSGVVDANPKRVTRNCKLIEAYAVAGVAPVDQDLYLEILSANLGNASILAAPIKIPAGETALHSSFAFYINPAYLFKNDVLRARATYVITGANPTPAGSVSFDIVGEY